MKSPEFSPRRHLPRRLVGTTALTLMLITGFAPEINSERREIDPSTYSLPPIDIEKPIHLVPVILASPGQPKTVSPEFVDANMRTAVRAMEHDFDGNLDITFTPTQTYTGKPEGKEYDTGEQCYPPEQQFAIADTIRTGTNEIMSLVADGISSCRTVGANGERVYTKHQPAAFAVSTAGFTMYNYKTDAGKPWLDPGTIMHESGHILGLGHGAGMECNDPNLKDMYNPYDPALVDISRITTTCDLVRNAAGQVNWYSADGSVMGYNSGYRKVTANGIMPAFSNSERGQLLPDIYKFPEVQPVPHEYLVGYGENRTNGIKFKLPEDHPLRTLADGIDELVISVEVIFGHPPEDEGYGYKRQCGDTMLCKIATYAYSSTSGDKVLLPQTRGYINDDKDDYYRRLICLDKTLGIGVIEIQRPSDTSFTLSVVKYSDALETRRNQEASRAAFFEQLKRDDAKWQK